MGIGVSDWRLAHTVSRLGHLGVVSGTAIDTLFVRRLQDGDPGGHMRRGLAAFPWKKTAQSILERYFLPEGRQPGEPYSLLSMWRRQVSQERERLAVAAAFVEVWLAREGHDGLVGMNLLTKVQIPNPATLVRGKPLGRGSGWLGSSSKRPPGSRLRRDRWHTPSATLLPRPRSEARGIRDLWLASAGSAEVRGSRPSGGAGEETLPPSGLRRRTAGSSPLQPARQEACRLGSLGSICQMRHGVQRYSALTGA